MQIWNSFLQQQEDELGKETVQKWLRSLKVVKFDAGNLYLQAKDSFQALWFEEHIRAKVETSLVTGTHQKIKVHLSISNAPVADKKSKVKDKRTPDSPPFKLLFDGLDPYCRLEDFIVRDENSITHKILLESQEGTYNPIYLYGGAGAGKTHLLMGLTSTLLNKGVKSCYVRAETFTDHVVGAIRAGEMSLFRHAYRNIDVLLMDGVQVFSRKGATQEEFFHTFNTLYLAGKQIILSANCSPQDLQLIEPRLVSRFEWGIVLPLKPLTNVEDLKKMVMNKAERLQFPLPEKLADFLIETFKSSPKALIKALEGLMLRLHLDTKNQITTLTTAGAKTLLNDLMQEEDRSALTSQKLIQAVAEQYEIRTEDILGKAQTKECTVPRQLAMFLIRTHLKIPYIKIGELFSRDHSTVMSSIKRIQQSLDHNEENLSLALHAIKRRLETN